MTTCRHCDRHIVQDTEGRWIDPEAPLDTDDSIWRETCDSHDTFDAVHEPAEPEQPDPYEQDRLDKAREAAASLRALYDPMSGRIDNWSEQ